MRTAYVALAGLLLLNVAYQFITAGMIVFDGEDTGPHAGGAGAAHLWAIGMLVVAAVGRLGRMLIAIPIVILLLVSAQYGIAESESIGFLHPFVALVIAFSAHAALRLARVAPVPTPAA